MKFIFIIIMFSFSYVGFSSQAQKSYDIANVKESEKNTPKIRETYGLLVYILLVRVDNFLTEVRGYLTDSQEAQNSIDKIKEEISSFLAEEKFFKTRMVDKLLFDIEESLVEVDFNEREFCRKIIHGFRTIALGLKGTDLKLSDIENLTNDLDLFPKDQKVYSHEVSSYSDRLERLSRKVQEAWEHEILGEAEQAFQEPKDQSPKSAQDLGLFEAEEEGDFRSPLNTSTFSSQAQKSYDIANVKESEKNTLKIRETYDLLIYIMLVRVDNFLTKVRGYLTDSQQAQNSIDKRKEEISSFLAEGKFFKIRMIDKVLFEIEELLGEVDFNEGDFCRKIIHGFRTIAAGLKGTDLKLSEIENLTKDLGLFPKDQKVYSHEVSSYSDRLEILSRRVQEAWEHEILGEGEQAFQEPEDQSSKSAQDLDFFEAEEEPEEEGDFRSPLNTHTSLRETSSDATLSRGSKKSARNLRPTMGTQSEAPSRSKKNPLTEDQLDVLEGYLIREFYFSLKPEMRHRLEKTILFLKKVYVPAEKRTYVDDPIKLLLVAPLEGVQFIHTIRKNGAYSHSGKDLNIHAFVKYSSLLLAHTIEIFDNPSQEEAKNKIKLLKELKEKIDSSYLDDNLSADRVKEFLSELADILAEENFQECKCILEKVIPKILMKLSHFRKFQKSCFSSFGYQSQDVDLRNLKETLENTLFKRAESLRNKIKMKWVEWRLSNDLISLQSIQKIKYLKDKVYQAKDFKISFEYCREVLKSFYDLMKPIEKNTLYSLNSFSEVASEMVLLNDYQLKFLLSKLYSQVTLIVSHTEIEDRCPESLKKLKESLQKQFCSQKINLKELQEISAQIVDIMVKIDFPDIDNVCDEINQIVFKLSDLEKEERFIDIARVVVRFLKSIDSSNEEISESIFTNLNRVLSDLLEAHDNKTFSPSTTNEIIIKIKEILSEDSIKDLMAKYDRSFARDLSQFERTLLREINPDKSKESIREKRPSEESKKEDLIYQEQNRFSLDLPDAVVDLLEPLFKEEVETAVHLLEVILSELPPEKRDILDTVRQHILMSFARRKADTGDVIGDEPRDLDVPSLDLGSFLQVLYQKQSRETQASTQKVRDPNEKASLRRNKARPKRVYRVRRQGLASDTELDISLQRALEEMGL